jgi:hypothetical protein
MKKEERWAMERLPVSDGEAARWAREDHFWQMGRVWQAPLEML